MTGGIGGVHRGAETTFDISADLTELGNLLNCKKKIWGVKMGPVPVLACVGTWLFGSRGAV